MVNKNHPVDVLLLFFIGQSQQVPLPPYYPSFLFLLFFVSVFFPISSFIFIPFSYFIFSFYPLFLFLLFFLSPFLISSFLCVPFSYFFFSFYPLFFFFFGFYPVFFLMLFRDSLGVKKLER